MDCYFDKEILKIFQEFGKIKPREETINSLRYSVGEEYSRERSKFVNSMLFMKEIKIKKA